MKYALFLQDLRLSRDNMTSQLQEVTGGEYEAVWYDSPHLDEIRNDTEILFTSQHEVGPKILENLPNLKMVSLGFTGIDKVDKRYCESRGLKLYYVPDYSSDSVAELTVGLTLSVLRKIPCADQSTRDGLWDKEGLIRGIELYEKKVGILGIGNIGTKSAMLFRAFGCTVSGWARSPRKSFSDLGFEFKEDLDDIFAESDIVVLHLPLDRGEDDPRHTTRHIVGARELGLMRPSSILINTARSELVDSNALTAALEKNLILGAGIDVFDEEPAPKEHNFMRLKNVVVTPHIGFKTNEALHRLADAAIKNIGRFLAGSEENLVK